MTQLFKPSLFLNRLVIKEEQYIVYDEKFHNGVNIIRGDNSSGKSTIMELIFLIQRRTIKVILKNLRKPL